MNSSNINSKEITYIVQKGDSLYQIAKKFNTSIGNLIRLNHLTNTLLTIGQVLIISKEEEKLEHIGSDICPETQQDIENKQPIYDTYTVKENENLYSIAKKFNTTVANLIYINNLKNNLLSIGQKIKVPQTSNNFITYIVKPKDTIYQIASNYNITPKQLLDFNQLSSPSLTIGQELKIPTLKRDKLEIILYTVKKEDSLYSISQKFGTTVSAIKKINHLINNLLFTGQELKIPK